MTTCSPSGGAAGAAGAAVGTAAPSRMTRASVCTSTRRAPALHVKRVAPPRAAGEMAARGGVGASTGVGEVEGVRPPPHAAAPHAATVNAATARSATERWEDERCRANTRGGAWRPVCKPGSVDDGARAPSSDGHFSRSAVTRALQQSTRGLLRPRVNEPPRARAVRDGPSLAAYLTLLRPGFTGHSRRRECGGLLPADASRLAAPVSAAARGRAPFHPCLCRPCGRPSAVCSLLHCPSPHRGPCGRWC